MTASSPTPRLRRAAALIAALLALGLLPAAPAAAQIPSPSEEPEEDLGDTRRLAGESRFDTAREIAEDAFPDGAENAIVVRGDTFPDALAGSFLAGVSAGPIIPVSTDRIPEASAQALDSITQKVFVLGGTNAVSATVEAQLKAEGLEVERIAGESRYDTARKVAVAAGVEAGDFKDMANQPPPGSPASNPVPVGTAFLATGDSFADALAAGPLAYFGGHPVILTRSDTLSDEAKAAIQDETLAIDQVIIVGGRQAVSNEVEAQVEELGKSVHRVSGGTRLETATMLADFYLSNQSQAPGSEQMTYEEINLALGQNFPDALALGARGGATGTVVVLAQTPEDLGDVTRAFIGAQCDTTDTVVVAGGESVISAETEATAGEAAICGTASAFSAEPADYLLFAGEEHTITVTVMDAGGNPVSGAYIKADVYRDDRPAPPEEFKPLTPPTTSVTGKTGADGTVALSYTYEPTEGDPRDPPEELIDTVVVCQHPQENSPSTCLAEQQRDENILLTQVAATWHQEGFRTELAGENVEPGPGHEEATGSGAVTFKTETPEGGTPSERLCWMVDVQGLGEDTITAAYLYKTGDDAATPPTVAVTLRPTPGETGFGKNCASAADFTRGQGTATWINDIKDNTERYFIQVHTEAFPDGAVRGDLA